MKSHDVCRNVIRLDNEPDVVVFVWTSPSADLEGKFAAVSINGKKVKSHPPL
jgi:hypothetical protein